LMVMNLFNTCITSIHFHLMNYVAFFQTSLFTIYGDMIIPKKYPLN
jgi:hypothetical protein